MKEKIKRDIKARLEDATLVVLCVIFVGIINRSCSNYINKDTKQKLEMYKSQNHKIMTNCLEKLQKNR